MEHIVIIADDLTGACDTGIKFRNLGIGTTVFVSSFNPDSLLYAGDPVISINTNTRSMAKENANRMLCKILYGIRAKGNFFYYKKIDSFTRQRDARLEVFFEMLAPELITFCVSRKQLPRGGRYDYWQKNKTEHAQCSQLLSDNTIANAQAFRKRYAQDGRQYPANQTLR